MKSLNKYISEGLYSNLGIDRGIDLELIKDWVDLYNSIPKDRSHGAATIDTDGNVALSKPYFDLTDNRLLDKGRIPDYVHLKFSPAFECYMHICASDLTSLKGLPVDKNICVHYNIHITDTPKLTDWTALNDNKNCSLALDVNLSGGPKTFKSLLANIETLKVYVDPSNVSVLNTIQGCVITNVIICGDAGGAEGDFTGFFKYNLIKKSSHSGTFDSIINVSKLKLRSFDFLKDLNARSVTNLVTWPVRGGWWDHSDDAAALYAPLFDMQTLKEIRFVCGGADWSLGFSDFKTHYQEYKDKKILPPNAVFPR